MVRWLAAVLMVASCASASSLPEEGPAGGSGGKIEDVKGGAAGTTALPGGRQPDSAAPAHLLWPQAKPEATRRPLAKLDP